MSKFHLRIKELRLSRKLSQQELANLLGISKSSINMYERGEREPSLDMLESIADFFNVDLDYLMGKSNNPQKYLIQPAEDNLLADEKTLLKIYRDFNPEGKKEALKRIEEMSNLVQYKKGSDSKQNIG